MKYTPWDRRLWGVEFSSPSVAPRLIGSLWRNDALTSVPYQGEPTRALLFTTRKLARQWCGHQNAEWKARDDLVSKWRVRPVRVRERVEVVR